MKEITINLDLNGSGVGVNLTNGATLRKQTLSYDENGKVVGIELTVVQNDSGCNCGGNCNNHDEEFIHMNNEFMNIINMLDKEIEIQKQNIEIEKANQEKLKKANEEISRNIKMPETTIGNFCGGIGIFDNFLWNPEMHKHHENEESKIKTKVKNDTQKKANNKSPRD